MSYLWDFGDGNTVSTNVNPVQHTYTSGGSYNVTLTVINSGGTSTEQTFTGQTVSNNGGPSATITSVINVPFLVPIVNSVSPSIGSSGTVVNISGVNFTGATAVFFGTTPASFTVQNDSLIIATAPNGVQGVVSITVTTPGGTSGVSSSSEFTYQSENILPPIFLKGEQKGNKFLTQTEYVNTIEWRAPQTGISPVAYRIYTDPLLTNLIANIPALSEVQAYSIHNQKKGSSTYYMISVGSSGEVSTSTPMVVL
jgi:PKD repeat protein